MHASREKSTCFGFWLNAIFLNGCGMRWGVTNISQINICGMFQYGAIASVSA
jgi:hypothetical protein